MYVAPATIRTDHVVRLSLPTYAPGTGKGHAHAVRVSVYTVVSDRTEYVCEECGWSVSVRKRGEEDASRLAIEHYLESGHSVEREDEADPRRWRPLWSVRR